MSNDSNGSTVYDILAFVFDGQDTAQQTLDDIKDSGALDGFEIAAQCIVKQDDKGKVHIHEPGKGGVGATVGAVAGGLLGLIGGPTGVLAMSAAGAAVGGTAGHYWGRIVPASDLKELGAALTPNTSAMLLLLEDTYSESVINGMSSYDTNVVTLTVGDDLSGEIAQYAAASTDAPATASDSTSSDSAASSSKS
jgi:uncharacterized membrane protein